MNALNPATPTQPLTAPEAAPVQAPEAAPEQGPAVAPQAAPEPAPETPEAPKPEVDLEEVIAGVTALQWLDCRRALGFTADQILEDSVAMMVVAATVVGARTTALFQWDKFAAMTPEQLTAFLDVEVVGSAAAKSGS